MSMPQGEKAQILAQHGYLLMSDRGVLNCHLVILFSGIFFMFKHQKSLAYSAPFAAESLDGMHSK